MGWGGSFPGQSGDAMLHCGDAIGSGGDAKGQRSNAMNHCGNAKRQRSTAKLHCRTAKGWRDTAMDDCSTAKGWRGTAMKHCSTLPGRKTAYPRQRGAEEERRRDSLTRRDMALALVSVDSGRRQQPMPSNLSYKPRRGACAVRFGNALPLLANGGCSLAAQMGGILPITKAFGRD